MADYDTPRSSAATDSPEPSSPPVEKTPSSLPPGPQPTPSITLLRAGLAWLRDYVHWGNFKERASTKVVFGIGLLVLLALKFVIVPFSVSRAVNVIAEGYGIDMQVEDWSAGLLDLSASANNVAIRVPGKYAKAELLTIDELELDLSLWRRIRGRGWVNEVRVKGPKLYLERQQNGESWNWHGLGILSSRAEGNSRSEPRGDPVGNGVLRASALGAQDDFTDSEPKEALFNVLRLRIEDMRLEWTENLPGNSGGGLINEQRATLFLDDVAVSAQDVQGLHDPRPLPTRVSLNARAADGKVSIGGQANFFAWSRSLPGKGGESVPTANPVWSPSFNTSLYLENLGAGAFARLTPEVAVRPDRGTITGTVELALDNHKLECRANVEVRDVTFAVNRSSPLLTRRGDQVAREVAQLRPVSGRYQFECGGLGTEARYRPVQAFLSQITRRSLKEADAPITVRAAAAADHTRYTTQPLDREYRSTVASMVSGADAKLLGFLELANRAGSARNRVSDTLGGLPGRISPSFP